LLPLNNITSNPRALRGSVILFCIFAWWISVIHRDIKTAFEGFLPIVWMYRYSNPNYFTNDFLVSMKLFDKSALMYVYPLAYKYFGLSVGPLIIIVSGLEIGVFAWSMYALTRTLLPKSSNAVPIIVVVMSVASFTHDMNFARYTYPFWGGHMKGLADGLRIFAIVMFLKKRYGLSFALLAVSFLTHTMMGITGGVLLFSMLMAQPREIMKPNFLGGAILSGIIVLSWIVFKYEPVSLSGNGIPHQVWFDLTKLYSFHLYPVDMGVFTFRNYEKFVPFVSFSLLLIFYFGKNTSDRIINRKVASGMFSMTVLTVAGVFMSVWTLSPAVIKLSLHKSNDLIMLLGLCYVVGGLINEIEYSLLWRKVIASAILISPFIMRTGYPVVYTILLICPVVIHNLSGEKKNSRDWTVAVLLLATVILLAAYRVYGLLEDFGRPSYTGGMYFLWFVVFLSGIILIASYAGRKSDNEGTWRTVVILLILCSGLFWTMTNRLYPFKQKWNDIALSYKDVQQWAQRNTAMDALFISDPSLRYGWREYSLRSSFGSRRELLHTSWAYTSDVDLYNEGLKRVREFSVDLDDYVVRMKPSLAGERKLRAQMKKQYYYGGDSWRSELAERYGIDYFIMIKVDMKEPSKMPVAYENKHFLVLSSRGPH